MVLQDGNLLLIRAKNGVTACELTIAFETIVQLTWEERFLVVETHISKKKNKNWSMTKSSVNASEKIPYAD